MTVKGNTIYVNAKDINGLNATKVAELEEVLLAAGYELSVESSDVR